jgi:hypothetical protein
MQVSNAESFPSCALWQWLKVVIASVWQCVLSIDETSLEVVGNEKGGGLGGWLLFVDAFGPWRSMSVYCLMLPSSFHQNISVSCL